MLKKILEKYKSAILVFLLEQVADMLLDYVKQQKIEKELAKNKGFNPDLEVNTQKKSIINLKGLFGL